MGDDNVKPFPGRKKKAKNGAEAIAGAEADFIRDKDKRIIKDNQSNIRLGIRLLDVLLRHDAFADRILITWPGRRERGLTDADLDRLWLAVDERHRFRPTMDLFRTVALDHARQTAFHPVLEYLDGLQNAWDHVQRVDNWLSVYGGATENEYTRAVGRLLLTGAVRRVRRPGCKFDELVVFEGPQGGNKSTTLKILAVKPDWFTDDLPIGAKSRETIEQTQGIWIAEIAELNGLSRKAEIAKIKNFMSKQEDKARLAYGRVRTDIPRSFFPVGTVNDSQYLRDPTGNRRFWPVRTPRFDLDALVRDRDQLWAEAFWIERNSPGRIVLRPTLWSLAGEEQDQRRYEDPWEQVILATLGDQQGRVMASCVWEIVGLGQDKVDRRTQEHNQRIGQVMQLLGFDRKRSNNVTYYWRGLWDRKIEVPL